MNEGRTETLQGGGRRTSGHLRLGASSSFEDHFAPKRLVTKERYCTKSGRGELEMDAPSAPLFDD